MKIASAPCSYGVFGGSTIAFRPADLLAAMADAGYTGSELGPPGFFGTPAQTARAFAGHGLTAVGSYAPLHLSLPDQIMAADLENMRRTLAELAACGNPDAVAVLADEGDAALRAVPWRLPGERGLNERAWHRAAERLTAACDLAKSFGVRPAFHPHYATYVEQAAEIDTLMALTDVPLCLDTGHFTLGGADPATYARTYAARLGHVHIKDIRHAVVQTARLAYASGPPRPGETGLDITDQADDALETWWADVACPLGQGDVPLEPFLAQLRSNGYTGWYVIEQDRAPVTPATWTQTVADQRSNHSWLVERG